MVRYYSTFTDLHPSNIPALPLHISTQHNSYNHIEASEPSGRKLRNVMARALGSKKQSTYSAEAEVALIARISPTNLQSECNTLVDFDMSQDDEDDTITLWGGNDYLSSRAPLEGGRSATNSRPSQALRTRKDKGPRIMVDRSQMLDPEDRTWDAPRYKLSSKLGFSFRKNSQPTNSANNSQRRARFPEAEVLDPDDSSWM
ncbi:uncharacterized protein C8R40DRAFT_313127 [Lentinula edodes]|uniref:uncharacterized protein n=1 Tax=Lentinula edodes TaxID=5353 RepID=UPI001E8DB3A1|nr:uncharacterized protein C8R40DRAFT_313127 [Lentinula edodes]KAH7874391.1 hypothetical protein C8R40DRAFT_313127 [Lentinula edodes]